MTDNNISLNNLLPHSFPFVLIDKVVEIEIGKKVVTIKNVSSGEEYHQRDINGDPAFPACYIIEAMAQTSGLLIGGDGKKGAFLSMIDGAKFYRSVIPGEQLIITSTLFHSFDPLFIFNVIAEVEGELVSEADITLALV